VRHPPADGSDLLVVAGRRIGRAGTATDPPAADKAADERARATTVSAGSMSVAVAATADADRFAGSNVLATVPSARLSTTRWNAWADTVRRLV